MRPPRSWSTASLPGTVAEPGMFLPAPPLCSALRLRQPCSIAPPAGRTLGFDASSRSARCPGALKRSCVRADLAAEAERAGVSRRRHRRSRRVARLEEDGRATSWRAGHWPHLEGNVADFYRDDTEIRLDRDSRDGPGCRTTGPDDRASGYGRAHCPMGRRMVRDRRLRRGPSRPRTRGDPLAASTIRRGRRYRPFAVSADLVRGKLDWRMA